MEAIISADSKSHTLAVVGDLHYEPPERGDYAAARGRLLAEGLDQVVQLGDQGGYSHCGSWRSFMEGREFLDSFGVPWATIIGNHDLEGCLYQTDRESIAAWLEAFGYERPFHTVELGPALGICLSSTAFRDNAGCHHEVHIDPEQIAWFEQTLAANRDRPTFVFTHAPIMGSGVRVLQSLHLRGPNAWVNHCDDPGQFIRLAAQHPQIKLWFSAHNHLGQYYPDSVNRVGNCTFVHTGVIGSISRDGERHSRLVRHNAQGFELFTVDHVTGALVPDVRCDYEAADETGWQRAEAAADWSEATHFAPPIYPADEVLMQVGQSVFVLHRGMIVEYDSEHQAPLGIVCDAVAEGHGLRVEGDRLAVVDPTGAARHFDRGRFGRFSQVWVPNPFAVK